MTTFELWVQTVATSSENQFMSQQVHNGISWIPIRRAEMFVQFTAIWPLVAPLAQGGLSNSLKVGYEGIDPRDGFAKMNRFQDAIRAHQLAVANGATERQMTFTYYNNSNPASNIYNTLISKQPLKQLQYSGIIQSVEKEYARFKDVFVRNYNMNVVTQNTANTPPTTMVQSITYAPTAADQEKYGSSWVDISSLVVNAQNLIKGGPNS